MLELIEKGIVILLTIVGIGFGLYYIGRMLGAGIARSIYQVKRNSEQHYQPLDNSNGGKNGEES